MKMGYSQTEAGGYCTSRCRGRRRRRPPQWGLFHFRTSNTKATPSGAISPIIIPQHQNGEFDVLGLLTRHQPVYASKQRWDA